MGNPEDIIVNLTKGRLRGKVDIRSAVSLLVIQEFITRPGGHNRVVTPFLLLSTDK